MHYDGTVRKFTYRIVQKDREYIEFLAKGIQTLGHNAWIYQEGKNRQLYVVEFSRNFMKGYTIKSLHEKIDYIRGYFDAEGGISRTSNVRYYIYFAQKNREDIEQLKLYLEELRIECGRIHNPSKRVAPDYWRFFVSVKSYEKFAQIIGSWHPIKRHYLRMKI